MDSSNKKGKKKCKIRFSDYVDGTFKKKDTCSLIKKITIKGPQYYFFCYLYFANYKKSS